MGLSRRHHIPIHNYIQTFLNIKVNFVIIMSHSRASPRYRCCKRRRCSRLKTTRYNEPAQHFGLSQYNLENTYPETPAAPNIFRTKLGGRTISFNISVSVVMGCPSSRVSSISYEKAINSITELYPNDTRHINNVKVIFDCRFRHITQVISKNV